MVEQALINAFNDCINRIARGQTISECLRPYPHFANQLRPMLEASNLVKRAQLPNVETMEAQDRVRFRFEQALNTPAYIKQSNPYRRILTLAASVVLIFGCLLSVTGIIAQNSLPSDPFYGLKRFTEDIRLTFASNSEALALQAEFEQRRIDETQALITQGRNVDVDFISVIDRLDNTLLIVNGLRVDLSQIERDIPQLQAGMRVAIRGRTENGRVIAHTIRIIREDDNNNTTIIPLPTAPATNTLILTNVATMTTTPSITATTTPTITLTHTRTPSATQTPTIQATSTPTFTPSPTQTRQATLTTIACVITPPDEWERYQVQANDTLFDLAIRTATTVIRINQVNCLDTNSIIRTGQIIYLPSLDDGDDDDNDTPTRPENGDEEDDPEDDDEDERDNDRDNEDRDDD